MTTDQIAIDAKQLLDDLSLYKIPVNPIEVCEKLNIKYDEQPYEDIDGILLVKNDRALIGINSTIKELGRKAFTCAHELGHYQYDIGSITTFQCNRNDLGFDKQVINNIELRANIFASELLLPRNLFLEEIRSKNISWDLLQELSQLFQTSLQATATRFVKLTDQICWLVVVKDGAIQRFTKADYNDHLLQTKTSFKPPAKSPKTFQETSAESWLYPSKKIKNKKLMYWPLQENQYGECPVLLWDKNNCLLDDTYLNDDFDDEMEKRDDDFGRRRR